MMPTLDRRALAGIFFLARGATGESFEVDATGSGVRSDDEATTGAVATARARILAFSLAPSRCRFTRGVESDFCFVGETEALGRGAGDDSSRALFFETTSTTG